MKKIVLGLVFGVSVVFGNNIIVGTCESGTQKTTIQKAIKAAGDGDTVKICKGDYNEKVNIDKKDKTLTITNGSDASVPSDVYWHNDDTPLTIKDLKKITISNIYLKSKNEVIDGSNTDTYIFSNLEINATDDVGMEIKDGKEYNLSNINVISKKQSIKLDAADNADINITNIDINSTDDNGIEIKGKKSIISIVDGSVSSKKEAIHIDDAKDVNLSNITVHNKEAKTINVHGLDDNSKIKFDHIRVNFDTQTDQAGEGIDVDKGEVNFDHICLHSSTYGLYFDEDVQDINITNSNFKTQGSNDDSNVVMRFKENHGDRNVSNSCFQSKPYFKFDDDPNNSYTFDGNYWVDNDPYASPYNFQDNSKDKNDLNDSNPLDSCPINNCEKENIEKNYKFDAWDTFRDITDRNISTKIVNNEFQLTIASLDENGSDYQEFNGTVCATIDNNVTKLDFRDINETNATFHVEKAIKDIKVHLSWEKDADENCSSSEGNETNSTDNFAIRPKKFNIDLNRTSCKAGAVFHVGIDAIDYGGSNSMDYNETNGTSFSFDVNDSNSTCSAGVLGNLPNPFKFSDGNISFDTNYSDVGDVKFTIHEVATCSDRFAGVDCKDKNITGFWNTDENLSIEQNSTTITVKPYRFFIVDYNFTRDPDQDWRYMGDVNDSNITISFKVQAQNKMGGITKKFTSGCYAHNVGFDINFLTSTTDGNISYFKEANITINGHDVNLSDINWSGNLNDTNFTDGNSSIVTYALNVYRETNRVKNPLDINVSDINTTYLTDTNVTNIGLRPDNNGSSFYYGRVKTHDISTNEQNINGTIDIEVYDTLNNHYVNNFKQETLNWYIMQKDNNRTIVDLNDSSRFDNITDTSLTTTIQSYENGVLHFDINNLGETKDAYIHVVDMPRYLWYSRYQDFNRSGDCSTHPCFQYHYIHNGNNKGIHSGDYNGSDIGSDYNATKVKRGVKVFR